MSETLLQSLAAYADGIRYCDIPQTVLRQAAVTLIDTVGCMISGSRSPLVDAVVASELARSGPGNVTVVGSPIRLPSEGAARANGYMGDLHELNDLTCGHAGIGNVAAVLAMGEALEVSGEQLLEALVVGIEVTCRVYSAFYPTMKPYTEVGMVSVGPVGSLGAAAASAKLMKLDQRGILHAMANAMAQAGWCPAEVIFGDGGSVKPLLFGSMPAAAGIVGALYARGGISGPSRILEGEMGYLRTVSQSYDVRPILDSRKWYLDTPRRKFHACCGYIHSAIDSAIAIRRSGVQMDKVARVRVHMPPYIVAAVSKTTPPCTANEARFHIQYCLALALLGEDVILPEHSDDFGRFISQPRVTPLIAAVEVVSDDRLHHYHQSNLELLNPAGELLAERFNDAPKGSPKNPLTDDEILQKFRRLSQHLSRVFDTSSYLERLLALKSEATTSWILGAIPQKTIWSHYQPSQSRRGPSH